MTSSQSLSVLDTCLYKPVPCITLALQPVENMRYVVTTLAEAETLSSSPATFCHPPSPVTVIAMIKATGCYL